MSKKQLLLMSSSNCHGHGYLEFAKDTITNFLIKKNNVKKVLFVPYASAKPDSYDEYTEKVGTVLRQWGLEVEGIHTMGSEIEALKNAQAVFIGGGNSFLLLKTLYDKHLVEAIRSRVLDDGIPYIGSSAGTNVSTLSISTTNDMPICLPPTFYALQLVNFNINPHYQDPELNGTHKGETREERIKEFHYLNDNPVLGLREGSSLLVDGDEATLIGHTSARLFQRDQLPKEFPPNSDMSFLL
ncbi:unnamed protein product [Diamesa serratosioi]